jgi:hypothetical protein
MFELFGLVIAKKSEIGIISLSYINEKNEKIDDKYPIIITKKRVC